jgi:hypothetical protein
LEDRRCLAVTVVTDGDLLQITGDDEDDVIEISDSGDGAIEVTDGGGMVLGSAVGIARIRLDAGGGSDTVSYALDGVLTTERSLRFRLGEGETNSATFDLSAGLEADLRLYAAGGSGEDTISVALGMQTNADADIELLGNGGDDDLSVNSVVAVPVAAAASESGVGAAQVNGAAAASLDVDMCGGWGNDGLTANLLASADMRVDVDMNGEGGDDDLECSLTGEGDMVEETAVASRFGGFGASARAGVYVDLNGGWGDDGLTATLNGVSAEHVKVELDGGSGDDDASLTVIDETVADGLAAVGAAQNGLFSGFNTHAGFYADVDGGSGDDVLSMTLGALATGKTCVDMNGGSGDDEMTFIATDVDIAADASLYVKLKAGSGDDSVIGTFLGQILGKLSYHAEGGPGDDTLVSNLTAAIGSTGELFAKSAGDSGTDEVTLNVFDLSGDGGASLLAELEAKIFDPGGHDILTSTDLVEIILNNGHRRGGGNCGVLDGLFQRLG